MLLQFSVSNYGCFRDRVTLNLAAGGQDKSLPENVIEQKLPGVPEKRWLKGIALYGANASGKSTVLRALRALQELVGKSAQVTDREAPILQIQPFALSPGQAEVPTAFAVAFVAEGVRYEYRVAATRKRIWHESLRAVPKTKEQLWFSRDWVPESQTYRWSPERPSGFKRDPHLEGYTLPNALFLSKAIANNRTDLEPVFKWITTHLLFLDLSASNFFGSNFFNTMPALEDKHTSATIINLLSIADLGISNARAVSWNPSQAELQLLDNVLSKAQLSRDEFFRMAPKVPELSHRGQAGAEIDLPWASESGGTHRFFSILGPFLGAATLGRILVIDELETSMHPLMVRELMKLYFNSQSPTNTAQILFTTHNPLLLDTTLLRRDQVWFTDKDNEGAAHLYPLTDYQPRRGESLVRGYLSGRYGGVPFLPEGLVPALSQTRSSAKAKSHA